MNMLSNTDHGNTDQSDFKNLKFVDGYFFDSYDHKLKPKTDINYDLEVEGSPITVETKSTYWKSGSCWTQKIIYGTSFIWLMFMVKR